MFDPPIIGPHFFLPSLQSCAHAIYYMDMQTATVRIYLLARLYKRRAMRFSQIAHILSLDLRVAPSRRSFFYDMTRSGVCSYDTGMRKKCPPRDHLAHRQAVRRGGKFSYIANDVEEVRPCLHRCALPAFPFIGYLLQLQVIARHYPRHKRMILRFCRVSRRKLPDTLRP